MSDAINIFPPGWRLVGPTGIPYSGATLEFYDAETTDAREMFSDPALSVSLGSIIYTDSEGYPVTAEGGSTRTLIYTGTGRFRVVIKDADGGTIATHDSIPSGSVAGADVEEATSITQAQADARYVRNPNALAAETTIANTDILSFWDGSASGNRGITFQNAVDAITLRQQVLGDTFNAGDRTLFFMAAAPIGWVKLTTQNDKALRVVSGDGGGTGGTAAFTTVFASRTPTGTVGATTLTIGQIPAHDHSWSADKNFNDYAAGSAKDALLSVTSGTAGNADASTANAGSSLSHAHGLTMSAMDFAVQYIDLILCEKS